MSDATDVLRAIDQLRRDLSGYHVPAGKEYEARTPGLNLDVYLTSCDGGWLDLDWETFNACFAEVD